MRISQPLWNFIIATLTLVALSVQPAGAIVAGASPDSPSNRIIPNDDTDSPFAAVGSIKALIGTSYHPGTGVPISRMHVLTAGHVIDVIPDGVPDEDPGNYQFILNYGSDESSTHTASAVVLHPDFPGKPELNDDLAIMTLRTPIPPEVPIYDLWRTPLNTGETLALVGYGRSGDGVSGYTTSWDWTIKRLGYNKIDETDSDDEGGGSQEVWRADFDGPDSSTNRYGLPIPKNLTLGNELETTGGQGDSGGSAFFYDSQTEHYYLAGITTFTFGWAGEPVAPLFGSGLGGILIAPYTDWIDAVLAQPLPGDVDEDGFVGGTDLSIILTNWGLSGMSRWQGDLSGDGLVGGQDYSEVLSLWGTGIPPGQGVTGTGEPATAIPEPLTVWLLVLGAGALLRRAR